MKKLYLVPLLLVLGLSLYGQSEFSLDKALDNATVYLAGKLKIGSKVVVLNFSSDYPKLSNYIIEELTGYIVNEGTLKVVDRQNLEMLRQEMNFQLSGEVDDETAQLIGKKFGAQTIISGAFMPIGDKYRLRIRAIAVETAEVQGVQSITITPDGTTAALTKESTSGKSGGLSRYELGDTGPGGGIIYYILGNNYMEVRILDGTYNWSSAQREAKKGNFGGFTDWRVPSKDELDVVYRSGLIKTGSNYWSCTAATLLNAWDQEFDTGRQGNKGSKSTKKSVLIIRRFEK